MPTDEWFKENPKVSAYIPQDLNEKLTEWMKGRSIKKVSQALTAILEEYLGVVQTEPITQPVRDDRLEALEQKVESLFQIVQELREPIQASSPKVIQTELFPVEPIEETLSDDEAIALLDAKQPIEVVEEIQDDEPDEVLYEFLEPETQIPDISPQKEAIKESGEESSLIVENSSPSTETIEMVISQPTMTNQEVAELIGGKSKEGMVRSRYKRNQTIEAKGYKFTPTREKGKPAWKFEKLEDEL